MIIDNSLLVSGTMVGNNITGQDIRGSNTAVLSTNVVDLSQSRDIGAGEPFHLYAHAVQSVEGATAVEIQAVTSASPSMDTPTVLASTGEIPVSALKQGARFSINLSPLIGSIGKRFLAARYIIKGSATAGSFTASFGSGIQDGQKHYPSAMY